jgi:hypothetical protein
MMPQVGIFAHSHGIVRGVWHNTPVGVLNAPHVALNSVDGLFLFVLQDVRFAIVYFFQLNLMP